MVRLHFHWHGHRMSTQYEMMLLHLLTNYQQWAMMQCLGEMCTYLPLPGAIATFATRYIDPAAGFAIGW